MSSFKKRSQQRNIPGTKISVQNGQMITSTGNPSLDHIIGGGLPIGSLILIEEDKFLTYSKVLAKYFLAEGIYSDQCIFLGSLDDDPLELIKKLPKPVENPLHLEEKSNPSGHLRVSSFRVGEEENDEMRIAWRYNNLPAINSEQSVVNIGHHFNLLEQIDEGTLNAADITYWEGSSRKEDGPPPSPEIKDYKIFHNIKYLNLLNDLTRKLKNYKFSTQESSNVDTAGDKDAGKSLLRICLTSLGSPLWYDEHFSKDFIKFITILKSIVRSFYTVCFLTIPTHLINILDGHLIQKIRNLIDFSIEIESFAGSEKETNPIFKEYHGLLNIKKVSALNSLSAFTPDTTDLAFKLRRKKFVIEKLHLPPELQEPEQGQQQQDIIPSLSCGGGGSNQKHLEF